MAYIVIFKQLFHFRFCLPQIVNHLFHFRISQNILILKNSIYIIEINFLTYLYTSILFCTQIVSNIITMIIDEDLICNITTMITEFTCKHFMIFNDYHNIRTYNWLFQWFVILLYLQCEKIDQTYLICNPLTKQCVTFPYNAWQTI